MADETEGQENEDTEGAEGTEESTESTEQEGGKREVDWRAKARSWERTAKKAQRERADYEKKLKDREDLDKSENEKAIEAARQEGEKTARAAAEKERRADRLENATIRLASRGFEIADDEGKKHTVKFADPDDAHTYIERMIRRGEIDEGDLFDDDGKVQTAALSEALTDLIASKPHLVADGAGGGARPRGKVSGSADGGKGSSGAKELEDRSADEWLTAIQQKR